MNFANVPAFAWLAVIVPIVGFFILKVRLRRVAVPTMLFWNRLFDEQQPRSIWKRMRHWLSLFIQILLVLLIVAALADPYFAWEIRQLRRVVLIVDNSASMNATDVTPSRLAAAKSRAAAFVHGLRLRDEVALITAGGTPHVASGFSSHRRTLTAAIDSVIATDNPTRVTEAVDLAKRLLGEQSGEQQREIVVLTDRELPALESDAAATETTQPISLRVHRFGTAAGNAGITQFQVRRSVVDPLGYELLVEVTNASEDTVECRLDLDLNGNVIDVMPLKLSPGQRWSQSIEKTSTEGGHLSAKLDRSDTLMADNQAWAVLPKRDPIPVTLISETNLFLQKVLESNPLVQLTHNNPSSDNLTMIVAPPGGIVAFHRQVPKSLPTGSVLVIDPRHDADLWTVGNVIPNPLVGQQDLRTATAMTLLNHVRLDNVLLPEARQVTFAGDETMLVTVLVRATGGEPLLAAIEQPQQNRKVLLLSVNLDEGDLPLRTAFPILMTNALNWFTENRGELTESLPTGSVSEIDVAVLRRQHPDARLVLIAPDGRRTELPSQADRASLGPFDQCGLWKVVASKSPSASDMTLLERACNLASRDESDIRVASTDATQSASAIAVSWFTNRPVWVWLIAAAWLLLALEWWGYQRRIVA